MFDSIESVIHTNTLLVNDTTELAIARTCQGIQHVKVRQYLSCTEMRYASLRGIALLHWKYNNVQKSWHATNCMEDIAVHLQDKDNCCVACHNAQNKIKKKTYPWLFQETSMLPSDDEIVRYIQHIYRVAKDNPSNNNVSDVFMTDIRLRKLLLIIGKEIDAVTLDERPRARSYLIRCSHTDHIWTTGNPVEFFFSATLNTGSTRLCQKCYSAQRYQLRKDN